MGEKFKDIYRIQSARLQNWDYGCNAIYFVTICTQNRTSYFGDIVETPKLGVSTATTTAKMQLSSIGEIAKQYWNEIPNHFPFVELGEFVVMPNHVHGIIIIDKPNNNESQNNGTPNVETPKLGVSTIPTNEIVPTKRTTAASEKWNPGTLGVIINQYKRICTINARKIHADFDWQSRFYDHIIRTDESFQRISEYIQNNPLNWHTDKFHNGSEL